jgi:hypothetical protein
MHELTHAVHHVYQLKERDQHRAFRRAQAESDGLSIITHTPRTLAMAGVGDDVSGRRIPGACAPFTSNRPLRLRRVMTF